MVVMEPISSTPPQNQTLLRDGFLGCLTGTRQQATVRFREKPLARNCRLRRVRRHRLNTCPSRFFAGPVRVGRTRTRPHPLPSCLMSGCRRS